MPENGKYYRKMGNLSRVPSLGLPSPLMSLHGPSPVHRFVKTGYRPAPTRDGIRHPTFQTCWVGL